MASSSDDILLLKSQVLDLQSKMDEATGGMDDMDTFYLVICGALIFFMQAGFAMLSVGAVRSKNAVSIIFYILLDCSLVAVAFYMFGYGFAYGDKVDAEGNNDGNVFLGTQNLLLHDTQSYADFFFQFAIAAATVTIVSGSVIERMSIRGYVVYSFFLAAFVYPAVAHWQYSEAGWLSAARTTGDRLFDSGAIDFGGCGAVHMVGGVSGIVGAKILGPRIGRYATDGTPIDLPGASVTMAALGTMMLWFSWYGFNGGATLAIVGQGAVLARVAATTTLAGAGGALGSLLFGLKVDGFPNVSLALNGSLAGLVSVTSGCCVMEPWAALLTGAVGGCVFPLASRLLTKLRVDDPLEAGAMHGGCGVWGLIATGLLAEDGAMAQVFSEDHGVGLFYGGGKMLGAQFVCILSVIAWVCLTMGPCFALLNMAGWLRVSAEDEEAGMDEAFHAGPRPSSSKYAASSGSVSPSDPRAGDRHTGDRDGMEDGSYHGGELAVASKGVLVAKAP